MTIPTSTRAALRRAICSELAMPFARRYPSYLTCDSASSSSQIVDADLTQSDDYWKNMWLYICANVSTSTGATLDDNVGEVRLIDGFLNKDNTLLLDRALPQAATEYDRYEIHDNWNAYEIHNAINRAIRDGAPDFFDVVEDETLILKEDTIEYDISSLTNRPWVISSVYIERPYNAVSGSPTATAATSLTDTGADFSDVAAGWLVSIYDGTGAGQLRTITSVTGTTQLNVAAWTTIPATTSKYLLWNPSEQRSDWYRVTSARFDRLEYPSTLYLSKLYWGDYGARIRLTYATDCLEMDDDADTTAVPKEFVVYKAIEILAASRVSSAKADREHYAILEQDYGNRAETYRQKHAFRMDTQLWLEEDFTAPGRNQSDGNPLDWSR